MTEQSLDPEWERRYAANPGYRNHYPWTIVVQFVFGHAPRNRPRGEVRVLEVGAGNGNNLWFTAREGFASFGLEGSQTAVDYANDWFAREGLAVDMRQGDFVALPYADGFFDLVFDRGSLSLTPTASARRAVAEVHRVLKPGGRFLFNPYSQACGSFHGAVDADGCTRNITAGSILPGSQMRFYSLADIHDLFGAGWKLLKIEHREETDMTGPLRQVHAEWLVIAEKKEGA